MKLFFTHTNMIFSMGRDGKDKVCQRKNEKQTNIYFSPPTGEYRKCNGGKWSRLPLQEAPTILHRHWQEKGDLAPSLVEVLMLFILLMIDYVHRSTNSDSMSHEQRLSANGTTGKFYHQTSKKPSELYNSWKANLTFWIHRKQNHNEFK